LPYIIFTTLYSCKGEVIKLPDIYIYGAQKCATTSLHSWLSGVHGIATSSPKEPEHFTQSKCKRYEKSFTRTDLITVDATPSGYSKTAPKKVFESNPDCKFIYIVRNPVQRFFSAYAMYGSRVNEHGLEWRINYEIKQYLDNPDQENKIGLLTRGIYIDVINSLLQYFPKDQVLILSFDELINGSKLLYQQLSEYIGVELPNKPFPRANGKSRGNRDQTNNQLEEFYQPYNEQLFNYCQRQMYD